MIIYIFYERFHVNLRSLNMDEVASKGMVIVGGKRIQPRRRRLKEICFY